MSKVKLGLIGACALVAVGVTATPANAVFIATYDMTGPTAGTNVDLGQTHAYTSGNNTAPALNATAGFYVGGSPGGLLGNFSTSSGVHIVGSDRGSDEQGAGVCGTSSGGCTSTDLAGEHGEIDLDSAEVIRFDVSPLIALGFTNFAINVDSATDGELLGTFHSNNVTLALSLGTYTSASGLSPINQTLGYLFVTSAGPNGVGGEDVLIHSLVATCPTCGATQFDVPPAVPEPSSIAMMGTGIIGLIGALGWRRRRNTDDNLVDMAAA